MTFLPFEPLDSSHLQDDLSATCVLFEWFPRYKEIKIKFNTVPFKTIRFHVDVNEVTCEDIKMWFPVSNDPKYNRECESGTVQISGSSRICSYSCQCQKYHGSGSGGCNTFILHMMKMGSVCDISVNSFTFT